MFLSFSALLTALADDTAEDSVRTAAFGVGLAVVPFVFLVIAFGSRHPRAPTAVLKALGVWVLVAISVGLISFGLGLVIAFGAGGMLTLRADDRAMHTARAWSIALTLVYVLGLSALLSPAIGLFAAGTVPLLALGFADQWVEARARASSK